jgi:histidinol-phosphate aminotransferase
MSGVKVPPPGGVDLECYNERMTDWSGLLRPELAELSSYVPADPPGSLIRLDANEAPPNPSPAVREAVLRAVASTPLERYPDARMRELKARISERTGVPPSELLVGTGLDEVIAVLLTAVSRPRPKAEQAVVLSTTPTFVMYRVTSRVHGLKPVEVPLDASWDLDVGAMVRAIEFLRPNVVFIASPNNPSSNRMSEDRIVRVLEAAPDAVVVLDEAYADFGGDSLRPLRARFPHLVIMRTLSKIGLAALRIGWLEGDEALVREVDKARQPFNISATSQAAAAAVLAEAWGEVRAHVAGIIEERDRLAAALREIPGVDLVPSDANFLWVATPKPAGGLYEALIARGVLVRSMHAGGGRLAHRLRVTVGSKTDNHRFLAAFKEVLSA